MTVFSTNAPIDRTGNSQAGFSTRRLPPSTAVISAHGEIDATNANDFAGYALRHTGEVERLAVDLTEVEFFGTAGLSALKAIEAQCSVRDIDWVLVPSKPVNRLLRICDPESDWHTCYSVAAALSTLNGKTPLLQLVTKSR